MKILYTGHYLEPSGWGVGCREFLRCLKQHFNVVSRPIVLSGGFTDLHPDIIEAEQNDIHNCDVVIQHVLPHYFAYNSNFRNIGLCYLETHKLQYTSWFNKFKLMDEIWTTSMSSCLDLQDGNINAKLVHQPMDMTKYRKKYNKIGHPSINANYNFYTIGEFSIRKRISSIIQCYYLAFSTSEPVNLVLKLNRGGLSPQELGQQVQTLVEQIQNNLKLYQNKTLYPEITIIPEYFTDEQLCGLHQSCQCYITTSYGEAVNIPLLDAGLFGNDTIASDIGGHTDIAGRLAEGVMTPVNGVLDSPFTDLFTGHEQWFAVNQNEIIQHMRDAYKEKMKPPTDILEARFGYTAVGDRIKRLLGGK
jgi:hypothetical protein